MISFSEKHSKSCCARQATLPSSRKVEVASQLRAQLTKSSGQHKLLSETGIPQLRNTSRRVGGGRGFAACFKVEKVFEAKLTLMNKFESRFKGEI